MKIRELRQSRRYSQKHLGSLAGLDQSYVSRIEAGNVDVPIISTLRRLTRALGVKPAELLADEPLDNAA
ncbi:helix-turn-helix domain-containing protein [Methylogaea oryzae]|uniref:HTH cro/C1-type domain-containing protein n=1 Tax=Methylogaea oryzae TaxID=1295382 RepID=A0A8D4VKJ9_9GAMM|nr:helix-turn-helix transcriptional regulator [Methylogaea oryzae]BBL69818.1 hypothetical protein MoryE10_04240 [Methylogaea oryzae]